MLRVVYGYGHATGAVQSFRLKFFVSSPDIVPPQLAQ
jgi:hypothetical protein